MAFTYTEEQLKVIELRNRNILVSAAAGSGKTTVLVERIIRMISDEKNPVDIDRLLVLTFTNAAACEMRERIREAIEEQLKNNPENEHLQRQSSLIHNALITTIHSFCLFLLKNNFNDIGLEPGFRIADEGELKLLKEEVLDELLEELFDSKEIEGFEELADRFITGNRMSGLKEIILEVYRYSMSYPFPEDWLYERRNDYDLQTEEDFSHTTWGSMFFCMLRNTINECMELSRRNLALCQEADGPYLYEAAILSDLELLKEIQRGESLSDFYHLFQELSFKKLSSKKDDSINLEKKESAKQLREAVKDTLQDLKKKYFLTHPDNIMLQMRENGRITDNIVRTVLAFAKRFSLRKKEKKIIDFSDMEHMALQILLKKQDMEYIPTQTAIDYRSHFKEIMIDEYQDSNMVQEWILQSIAGEREGHFNRFMVGDVKQSIYKFRLACPEIFMEKYDTYQKEDSDKQRIDLSKNYRSRKEVIDSVNYLFERIMTKEMGNVSYDENSALHVAADYPDSLCDNKTELFLIEKDNQKNSKQEQEASVIASRIKELVGSFNVKDKKTGALRKAQYRDIVILLRTNSGWDEEFKRVLEQEGIPVYIESKTGYFSTTEIRNVMNFLRVLDNPKQDIALYGTMISCFGGFNEDEVAMIRTLSKKSLFSCLEKCAKEKLTEEEKNQFNGIPFPVQKCKDFLGFIEEYRMKIPYEPIYTLLRDLFVKTDYLYEITALPCGEQRRANVNMLLEKAESYEKSSYQGLFHFIRYIEQIQKYDVDYGEAATLNENADVVRIMSIHKSKGLEFPICFVSGLSKKFNMSDAREQVILEHNYGIALDYVNIKKRVKYTDFRKKVIAEKMRQDNLAEEIRVLYVALTRAKEKLIMTGLVDDFQKLAAGLQAHLCFAPSFLFLRESSYLYLILDALLHENGLKDALKEYGYNVHKDKVISEESLFTVRCIKKADMLESVIKEQVGQYARKDILLNELERSCEGNEKLESLREQITFIYPHENLQKLYTKTTVSELKMADIHAQNLFDNREDVPDRLFKENDRENVIPRFASKEVKVSGAARGSAYHRVMELLDFDKLGQNQELPELLKKQLESFETSGRMNREDIELVDTEKIKDFLETELAGRMREALVQQNLYREQPFVLGVSASRLSSDFPEEETVLIQGIIDAYYIEDNEIVLLDYKTDIVKNAEELIERYQTQLDYYKEALERITGLRVKEKLIYSFALKQVIDL